MAILVISSILLMYVIGRILIWRNEQEKIDSVFSSLGALLDEGNFKATRRQASGKFLGYEFKLYLMPSILFEKNQLRLELYGNLPKQDHFMFSYPKYDGGIYWANKLLCKSYDLKQIKPLDVAIDCKQTLEKMVLLANKLENESV